MGALSPVSSEDQWEVNACKLYFMGALSEVFSEDQWLAYKTQRNERLQRIDQLIQCFCHELTLQEQHELISQDRQLEVLTSRILGCRFNIMYYAEQLRQVEQAAALISPQWLRFQKLQRVHKGELTLLRNQRERLYDSCFKIIITAIGRTQTANNHEGKRKK